MKNNLSEHLAEVILQLKEQTPSLFWKDAEHCSCYPPNPEKGQTEVLPDRIVALITQAITKTAKLTYEAVRPDERPTDTGHDKYHCNACMIINKCQDSHNRCLLQLDANWESFIGEHKHDYKNQTTHVCECGNNDLSFICKTPRYCACSD